MEWTREKAHQYRANPHKSSTSCKIQFSQLLFTNQSISRNHINLTQRKKKRDLHSWQLFCFMAMVQRESAQRTCFRKMECTSQYTRSPQFVPYLRVNEAEGRTRLSLSQLVYASNGPNKAEEKHLTSTNPKFFSSEEKSQKRKVGWSF